MLEHYFWESWSGRAGAVGVKIILVSCASSVIGNNKAALIVLDLSGKKISGPDWTRQFAALVRQSRQMNDWEDKRAVKLWAEQFAQTVQPLCSFISLVMSAPKWSGCNILSTTYTEPTAFCQRDLGFNLRSYLKMYQPCWWCSAHHLQAWYHAGSCRCVSKNLCFGTQKIKKIISLSFK